MKAVVDFENNLKRLEDIVTALEKEEHSLEETVKLFQEGMNLSKECRKALKEVDLSDKKVVKKTLTQMMKQSFFHGANRFGTNFIA